MGRAVNGPLRAVRRGVPGLVVLATIGVAAELIGGAVGFDPLLLAVVIGAVVANGPGVPAWSRPGVAGHALLLEVAIVLLGARLALDELVAVGPRLLGLAVAAVLAAILLVEGLSRLVTDLDRQGASLLAAGAGICGVSAVAAVATSIDADDHVLAYAAATVVFFDAVTLAVFPVIGSFLGIPARPYGVWVGLAMFSTGPATAVGFAAGPTAGVFATLAKLSRNALIGPVVACYAVVHGRSTGGSAGVVRTSWSALPRFLVGFVLIVGIANLGVLSPTALARIDAVAAGAFLLAFAGLGLSMSVESIRRTGLGPLVVVGGSLLAVGTLALLVTLALF